MQAVANNETTVIVHEGDQVDAAILPLEDKGKQVGLPELIGLGAFEVTDLVGVGAGGRLFEFIAGLMQHPGDRRGAGGEGRTTPEHVADALAAPVGVRLLEHKDGAARQIGELAAASACAWLLHEPGWALGIELLLPGVEGVLGEADHGGEVTGGESAALPGIEQEQPLLGR